MPSPKKSLHACCVWTASYVGNVSWQTCAYHPDDDRYVGAAITRYGSYEADMVRHMIAILRRFPGTILVDIGAHIGTYTLAAAAAGFDVEAFEPAPTSVSRLIASVERNAFSRVRVYPVALSDRVDVLGMGVSAHNQGGVQHRPNRYSRVQLPAMPLDVILRPSTVGVYIKLDVEGAECAVVEGMRKFVDGTLRIVGVTMEFGQSRQLCCEEWTAPRGFFDILRTRHSLCPAGVSYGSLCESSKWDLTWVDCSR